MTNILYQYTFSSEVDIAEVEATVTLALMATESLHGESRVQLEARHEFNAQDRTCRIDAAGEIGRDLNRLFLGFMNREFGRDCFEVERLTDIAPSSTSTAA